MKIVRAFNFTTIVSDDWKRELARARANPNEVAAFIRAKVAELKAEPLKPSGAFLEVHSR